MTKLSNQRIVNDVQALSEIIKKQLPVKVSYAIAKNMAKIESELKTYNSEREKLLDKYAEKGEDGKLLIKDGNFTILQENQDNWNSDIAELLEIENEIDIHKFSINEFNGKTYDKSPMELMLIDYMIEE